MSVRGCTNKKLSTKQITVREYQVIMTQVAHAVLINSMYAEIEELANDMATVCIVNHQGL
jgi:hypothetical protein